MREAIRLPAFGEGVAEAEIVTWLVEPGDAIRRGDDVVEVATSKATMTVAAPTDGTLTTCEVEPGTMVPVETVLGYLETTAADNGGDDEADDADAEDAGPRTGGSHFAPDRPADARPTAPPAQSLRSGGEAMEAAAGPRGAGFLSPRARKRIDELGIHAADFAAIRGSGQGGRVTSEDLERFLNDLDAMPQETADPARLAIADAMRRSWTRPLATVARRVLLDELLAHRRTVPGRPSLTVYAARALARVLEEDKRIARRLVGRHLVTPPGLGIAVAVAVGDAVLTPAVPDVHSGSLETAAQALDAAVKAARSGRISGDIIDAIATVSNYGSLDITWATPIPPAEQSLLLGVGRVEAVPTWDPRNRSWARAAGAEITLTFDHRVADGGLAARVLHQVCRLLEHPDRLI